MKQGRATTALVTAIAALLVSFVGAGISIVNTTTDDGHGNKQTSHTIKFNVDRSGSPGTQTATVTVPKAAVQQVTATTAGDHSGLRDETPPIAEQLAPGQLTAAQQAVAQIKATQPPLPTAGATAGIIGCRTEFVQNQSSRNGVRPQLQVLHYTVSPNRPGWSDVEAVVHLFNTRSAQVSSNFVIDGEGNCAYIVPIENKAWAQAAANPYSVSYEIINSGKEPVYIAPAGLAKLRSVMAQVSKRTGIPMRAGVVKNCVPVTSGIVQHFDFGYCGGGHFDITPFHEDAIIKALTVQQPVAKSVKWLAHRKAIHEQYQRKCKHAYQRQRRPVTCAKLRDDARKLDRLLRRKPA